MFDEKEKASGAFEKLENTNWWQLGEFCRVKKKSGISKPRLQSDQS